MLDKNLVKEELGNIFKLISACLDPNILIEMCNQKLAGKKFADKSFAIRAWNQAIYKEVADNNKKHKDEMQIELPPKDSKEGNFAEYAYNMAEKSVKDPELHDEAAQFILEFCFSPERLRRQPPKHHEWDGEERYYDQPGHKHKTKEELQKEKKKNEKGEDVSLSESEIEDAIEHNKPHSGIINKYRDLNKEEEKKEGGFVAFFRARANIAIKRFLAEVSARKEVRFDESDDDEEKGNKKSPKIEEIPNKDDDADDTSEIVDSAIKEAKWKEWYKENSENLSTLAKSYIELGDFDMKTDERYKELKVQGEHKKTKLQEELCFFVSRFAIETKNEDLILLMEKKELFDKGATKRPWPGKKPLSKEDLKKIIDIVADDKMDWGEKEAKIGRFVNLNMKGTLNKLHKFHGSEFLSFLKDYYENFSEGMGIQEYSDANYEEVKDKKEEKKKPEPKKEEKTKQDSKKEEKKPEEKKKKDTKKELSPEAEKIQNILNKDKKKKSNEEKISSIVEYLEELVNRLHQ